MRTEKGIIQHPNTFTVAQPYQQDRHKGQNSVDQKQKSMKVKIKTVRKGKEILQNLLPSERSLGDQKQQKEVRSPVPWEEITCSMAVKQPQQPDQVCPKSPPPECVSICCQNEMPNAKQMNKPIEQITLKSLEGPSKAQEENKPPVVQAIMANYFFYKNCINLSVVYLQELFTVTILCNFPVTNWHNFIH